jgi:hypothetical protein
MVGSKSVPRMICPNCGMSYLLGSPYCSRCGKTLNKVAAAHDQTEAALSAESLATFLSEDQDVESVRQILQKASLILNYGEEIEYIATANKTVAGLVPDCMIATDRRLINYKKKLLGKTELDDCLWRDVHHIDIKPGRQGSLIRVATMNGWRLIVDSLPRAQAWRLFELGAQHNLRLKMKLQQALAAEAATVQAPVPPVVLPVVASKVPPVVPPVELTAIAQPPATPRPEKVHFVQQEVAPDPQPAIEPQPTKLPSVQPTNAPVADSLAPLAPLAPLVLLDPSPSPPNIGPDATLDPLEQPRTAATPVNDPPVNDPPESAAHSASRTLDDLDDMFFALLGKDTPRSTGPDEQSLSEADLKTQPSPPSSEEWPEEASTRVPIGLSYPGKYQEVSESSSPAAVSNGLNGNGEPYLEKTDNLPVVAFHRPEPTEAVPKGEEEQKSPIPVAQKPASANAPKERIRSSAGFRQASSSSESPMRTLKQLKTMLDEGLITQADYETKKADILSRI